VAKRISAIDAYINRCLDYGSEAAAETETQSTLWRDLAAWAFAQDPEIPAEMKAAAAEALLDKAAREVKGLRTVASWKSAARYFNAENFHALTDPACLRARRLEKTAKPIKT
jgi:hypothetical protein